MNLKNYSKYQKPFLDFKEGSSLDNQLVNPTDNPPPHKLFCTCKICRVNAIYRGEKLLAKEDLSVKYESLKKILTTPVILKIIFLEAISYSINVSFFSIILLFPLSFSNHLNTQNQKNNLV